MNRAFAIVFFFLLILSGITACKRDPGPKPDLGYNYFPDAIGTYVVYNVDSFAYNSSTFPAKADTIKYQLKEKIASIYSDNEGRSTIRLERYIKKYNRLISYNDMSWTLRNVWAENKTLRSAEKVEDNVRFVKLVFPVKEEQQWNGNAKNVNDDEEYKYGFIDLSRKIGTITFDSVLQVIQHDEKSLVSQNYAEEKYARNVGFIYKRVINVDSQYPTSWNSLPYLNDSLMVFYGKDILDRVSSGYQYTMSVSAYGKE